MECKKIMVVGGLQPKEVEPKYDFADTSSDRLAHTTVCLPIVYGSIAFFLGKKADEYHTHKWTLYLRGPNDEDLSLVIQKVVFQLHPSFPRPVRELTEPPFEVTERGWGEFEAQIRIVWKDSNEKAIVVSLKLRKRYRMYHCSYVISMEKLKFNCLFFYSSISNFTSLSFHANNFISLIPIVLLQVNHGIKLYPPGSINMQPIKEPVVAEVYDEVVFTEPKENFFQCLMQIPLLPKIPFRDEAVQSCVQRFSDEEDLQLLLAAQDFLRKELQGVKSRLLGVNEELEQLTQRENDSASSRPMATSNTAPSTGLPAAGPVSSNSINSTATPSSGNFPKVTPTVGK
jgi:YEATS domain-containing protein 4